jgi:uncharacterized protein
MPDHERATTANAGGKSNPMKLGILSDSHGRIPLVRQALTLLDQAGAEAFIHCGDVGGLEVLEEFASRRCWFVWGNTDTPDPIWRPHLQALGLPWPGPKTEVTLENKHIAVFHGHEYAFHDALIHPTHDYLFHGHTHQRDDYFIGRMHVINPGALHRVSVRTVALLDPATDTLEFLELK